jgi:hypothetical protein
MPRRYAPSLLAALAAAAATGVAWAGGEGEATALFRTSLKETASERLQHAVAQLWMPETWIEIIVGIVLAVVLASLLAFHPRSARRRDMVEASEERKTLVVLGMIGAVVSSLVLIDQTMAFVIFGIGGLIRFRTVIGNPHMTGRAILVVVIGLACGLSQYATALVVAVAAWLIIWWLQARRGGEIKVRIPIGADRQKAELVASLELRTMHCQVRSLRAGASGRSFTMVLSIPSSLDDMTLCRKLETRLATEVGHTEVEVKSAP